MKRILFIGDSLIEFFDWKAQIPGHNIANLGRAGETVEELLARLGAIVSEYPLADLIFIMTGINNVAMEDFQFLGSYRKILEELSKSYPKAGVFILSLLPTLLPWASNSSILELNRLLAELAGEKGMDYLDLYRKFVDDKGVPVKNYLLPDGVHLSDRGYAVWAEALEGIIEQ
jgi:lysophospholipase L1-like esterase